MRMAAEPESCPATKNALILKGINTFFSKQLLKVARCTLLWSGGAFMRDIFLGPDPGAQSCKRPFFTAFVLRGINTHYVIYIPPSCGPGSVPHTRYNVCDKEEEENRNCLLEAKKKTFLSQLFLWPTISECSTGDLTCALHF